MENKEKQLVFKLVFNRVIEKLNRLQGIVSELQEVYEENEWLNNVQPLSTEKIIPYSLDEWGIKILDNIEEWEQLRNKEK